MFCVYILYSAGNFFYEIKTLYLMNGGHSPDSNHFIIKDFVWTFPFKVKLNIVQIIKNTISQN